VFSRQANFPKIAPVCWSSKSELMKIVERQLFTGWVPLCQPNNNAKAPKINQQVNQKVFLKNS